ncbi:hypothetical protein AZE42_06339 [Rhizopogon vesiculosus]|uniref:Uncharacterized protein n=1 Tax=Rhizopogon vesiculosus TaxID=180088 RepID=A0A1J8QGY9_9AGAM|nr:hypothetical protein AZE42_06339 [Rhizopogon vesiculosus]
MLNDYPEDQIAVTDVAAAALEDVSMTSSPSAYGSARRTRPFQTHLMRRLLVLPGITAVPPHIPPTRAQLVGVRANHMTSSTYCTSCG